MAKWSDKPKDEKKADIERHKSAKKALGNSKKLGRDETPAFRQLNSHVIETEKEVPWWRR